jgi:peptidoglycan/LPS O-acetylase OafA/YrhL
MMFYAIFSVALILNRSIALTAIVGSLCAFTALHPFLPAGTLTYLASPIVLWFVIGVVLGSLWHGGSLQEPRWLAKICEPLRVFGDASYSTYLSHGLVLTMTLRAWMLIVGAPTMWLVPLSLVTATIVGTAVHIYIEKPVLWIASNPRIILERSAVSARQRPTIRRPPV